MERALVSTEVGRERNDFPFGDRKQPCSFRVSQCTWSRQVSETYALCLWVPLTQFAIWPGSHISPAFCVSCYFLFFSFISKRLQDSRYQGLSSKAVGPQTGKRESFQGKNGPVKKKCIFSVSPQPGMQCALRVAILVMKCSRGRKRDLLPAQRSPAAVAGHRESGLSAEGPWRF